MRLNTTQFTEFVNKQTKSVTRLLNKRLQIPQKCHFSIYLVFRNMLKYYEKSISAIFGPLAKIGFFPKHIPEKFCAHICASVISGLNKIEIIRQTKDKSKFSIKLHLEWYALSVRTKGLNKGFEQRV